ncbi:heterogeneous nuclear ribonucleoprotein A3 homolog 2-like isoform X2 [Contarinia nasturtii]|uniref:heterogeneous nuclear ribonucleoprotein A3 homolog 2-like isoform X2 n=1 Tax=Contarinia nasturtii TaxID=265458 RepID=UPI0012D39D39|nr:heterogeneous nuclear ribonucleoprotein A3 homolog 2-like isoform X2 [Contarinia nasturtii]
MMKGVTVISCLCLLLNVDAQTESKWNWSSKNRNNNEGVRDRPTVDRRKYESLEDFRDRYEVSEYSTRKPNTQADEFYGNSLSVGGANGGGGYGFNGPNNIGNGYHGNGFGAYAPQGLGGGPNNFNNYPLYGNQANGPYNPGFGYQPNNFKPGFNNNFYPNGGGYGPGFTPNYGNGGQFYPGSGIGGGGGGGGGSGLGGGPNRYPGGYNPLGNSAANGVLVGPGGPTGLYGRPPNYAGPGQLPFGGNGIGLGGVGNPYGFNNNGFYNNYGTPYGNGYPQNNGIIPFNSKAGSGILADAEADDPKGRELDKKSNK